MQANPEPGVDRRRWRPVLGLMAWVVVLPLCLLGLGLWQVQRGAEDAARYARAKAELPAALDRARQIAAQNPNSIVRFGNARALGAALAVKRLEEAAASVDRNDTVARARLPAAWATIAGAVLALLAGLAGTVASSLAGLAARRSRDWLVRGFALIRGLLPVLLGAQILGLAVCAIGATAFEASGLWFMETMSAGAVKLALAGLLLAGVAVYGAVLAVRGLRQVFALHTPDPVDISGRMVSEAEAPGLWRYVRELARRQESLAPDVIAVGLTEGFFVTEAPVRLWPEDRLLEGRTLYLQAPYFGLLDGRELAAIIGHELAHFAGQDTRYSSRFAPIYTGLRRAMLALQRDETGTPILFPAVRLGFHAIHTFDTAVARWSRIREFEADRRGAQVPGIDAAASALLRTSVIGPVIAAGLERAFDTPAQATSDIVAEIESFAQERGFGDPTAHLDDRQPHPTDSHPPDRKRIEALGVAVDPDLMARASRQAGAAERDLPLSLFSDWPGLCRRLSEDFLANAERFRAAERSWLEQTAAAVSTDAAELHENGRVMAWTMGVLVALVTAFGASVVIFAQPLGIAHDPTAQTIIVTLAAGIALVAALYGWWMLRRSASPFLTLSPQALHSPFLREPVAWTDVLNYRVSAGRGVTLDLVLSDEGPLPVLAGRSLRARLNRRKRLLSIKAMGVRGMKPEAFAEMVGRYIDAAHARTALSSAQA